MSEVQPAAEILAVSVDHGHLRDTCGHNVRALHALLSGAVRRKYQRRDNSTPEPLIMVPVSMSTYCRLRRDGSTTVDTVEKWVLLP